MSGPMRAGYLHATQVGGWIEHDGERMVLKRVIHTDLHDEVLLVLHAAFREGDRRTFSARLAPDAEVVVEDPSHGFYRKLSRGECMERDVDWSESDVDW